MSQENKIINKDVWKIISGKNPYVKEYVGGYNAMGGGLVITERRIEDCETSSDDEIHEGNPRDLATLTRIGELKSAEEIKKIALKELCDVGVFYDNSGCCTKIALQCGCYEMMIDHGKDGNIISKKIDGNNGTTIKVEYNTDGCVIRENIRSFGGENRETLSADGL